MQTLNEPSFKAMIYKEHCTMSFLIAHISSTSKIKRRGNNKKEISGSSSRPSRNSFRSIFKCQSETWNFGSLSLNQFSSVFCIVLPDFFILKIWVPKPYTHLSYISNFCPQLSDFSPNLLVNSP